MPKKTKTIYFIRHGQSNDNVAPVFQSPDSPLSATGKQQAEAIAKRIANVDFDALISSPLHRTKETAEIISQETNNKIELSSLFVERIKPDAIIGKPYEDPKASLIWREWEKSLYTPGMRVDNGENFDDLIKRADEALDFLKNRSEDHIVVVTHGYFLRTVIARILLGDSLSGENFRNFQKNSSIENTALTIIKFKNAFEEDATWRLDTYNDYSHLDK